MVAGSTTEQPMVQVIEGDFDIDVFLAKPLLAHLATRDEAGVYETPAWFLWEKQALWIIASSSSSFPKRLQSDPRAAVGIVDFDLQRGFLRHLGLRGTATVQGVDLGLRTRLVCRYLGPEDTWNQWFCSTVVDRQDVLVNFMPTTAVARDQSYFRYGDDAHKAKENT
jgi:hypothetical protein